MAKKITNNILQLNSDKHIDNIFLIEELYSAWYSLSYIGKQFKLSQGKSFIFFSIREIIYIVIPRERIWIIFIRKENTFYIFNQQLTLPKIFIAIRE